MWRTAVTVTLHGRQLWALLHDRYHAWHMLILTSHGHHATVAPHHTMAVIHHAVLQ